MTQICQNCRTPNTDTSKFCLQCAAPLAAAAAGDATIVDAPAMAFMRTGMLPANTMLQNRYIIIDRLGKGGMGAVYSAIDSRISGKRWAIKEMSDALITGPLEKQAAVNAFRQEAEMLARLSHPNLPAVTDFFSENGKIYLVMELVQGHTLEALLAARAEPFPEAQVADWADQLGNVLSYLHQQNPPIVFRDLKPSNIMVEDTGLIKLIDFGIARFFKAGHAKDTQAMGTPGYASPEQYGHGQTDARSDVYSLGVTMHHLLTKHDPGLSPFNLPPTRQLNPAISPQMDAAVARATQTNPALRFASVAEMQRAISVTGFTASAGSQATTPPMPLPVAPRSSVAPPQRGTPVWIWLGVAVIAMVICLVLAITAGVVATQTDILAGLLGRPTDIALAPTATPTSPLPTDDGSAGNGGDNGGVQPPAPATTVAPPPPGEPSFTPTVPVPTATPTSAPAGPTVTSVTLGNSAGGRPIEGVQVGSGAQAVVLMGGLHAGFAPGTVDLVSRLQQHFVDNPAELPASLTLYFFPNVNPDSPRSPGELAGRLNANGVDLNRNFACNWSAVADWRGTPVDPGGAPFSEPETSAIRDFARSVQPAVVVFYEARASNGIVAAGRCNADHTPSNALRGTYAAAAGYAEESFVLNGDSSDWLVSEGIPSISILLKEYEGLSDGEWRDNLRGIRALLLDLQS